MNDLIEWANNFLGERPGLLPLVGLAIVALNLILQIVPGPGSGWFVDSNVLLHVGVIVSLLGILLIRPLS